MRSNLTVAEHRAAAMMLGMWYDPEDHSYNNFTTNGGATKALDADTMEPTNFPLSDWMARKDAVKAGLIGAADASIQADV